MKKFMLVLIASTCCTAFAMNASAQQADQATADAVIAMTKAQWAAEIKDPTSVAEQMKDASDGYTEFNGDYATRLDHRSALDDDDMLSTTGVRSNTYTKELRGSGTRHRTRISHAQRTAKPARTVGTALAI